MSPAYVFQFNPHFPSNFTRAPSYDAMMAVALTPSGPTAFKITSLVDPLSTIKLVRMAADHFTAKCLCTGNAINIFHFSSPAVLTSRYADYLTFHSPEKHTNIPDDTRYLLTPARACFVVEGQDVVEPIHRQARGDDLLRLRCVSSGEIVALTRHSGPQTVRPHTCSTHFIHESRHHAPNQLYTRRNTKTSFPTTTPSP